MIINFHMFGAGMKHGISGEVSGTNVVAPENGRVGKEKTKFLE